VVGHKMWWRAAAPPPHRDGRGIGPRGGLREVGSQATLSSEPGVDKNGSTLHRLHNTAPGSPGSQRATPRL
jgi:hypothetical protein